MSFKNIISEELSKAMEPRFKAMADFIEDHGGDDLVRHLHAQDVEITSHSTGALLKCYRTDEKDTRNSAEDCWRFWSGRYEVDLNHLDDGARHFSIGFTQQDLRKPIEYIIDRTKSGALDTIDTGTLVVFEIDSNTPEVRMHMDEVEAKMVVVGVRYEASEDSLAKLLSGSGDLEEQALKRANSWESHSQVQGIAEKFGTDSLPLLFRGKLLSPDHVVAGMEKSAQEDSTFSQLLNNFLAQAGDDPTDKDYQRFFRHALKKFDNFEIRKLDKQGKVADGTLVTKSTYKDVIDRIFNRYEDVQKEIVSTIDQYGKDSQEHKDDYRDLNYMQTWCRDQVPKLLFSSPDSDPITQAIHAIEEIKGEASHEAVLQWVRRHLEEDGCPSDIYAQHLRDENIPQDRHLGRSALWEQFISEMNRFIETRLGDTIADASIPT